MFYNDYDDLILKKDLCPLGNSYDQWCIQWCIWLLSIPKNVNPVFDESGDSFECTDNPYYPKVLFLCQTIEPSKSIPKRNIKIPYGSMIFLPIINWISPKENEAQTDEELKISAKEKIDSVGRLELYINNNILKKDLSQYRLQPTIFEMILPMDNILDVKPGYTKLVTDGYWIFLKPLKENLDMASVGSCSLGVTEISVNYHIELEN